MIEQVTKSCRRNEKIDSHYIEKLYDDMKSLYRLDDISADVSAKKELGPLPKEAVIFIVCLICVWIATAIYTFITRKKSQKH